MVRLIKSLQQNAEFGENRPAHREHRSKKGRNRIWKIKSDAFLKFKDKKRDLKEGVDKKSLRFIEKEYNIKLY